MTRTIATVLLIVLALLIIVTVAVVGPGAAGASDPSPSASPSPTTSPLPPASAATVNWATSWMKAASRARTALSRVRRCFGTHPPACVLDAPNRGATEAAWVMAAHRWRGQARDWRQKHAAGIAEMRHPGGSGVARWIPAMRWTGWSEYGIRVMVPVADRECGSPHRWNQAGSPCYGIWQIHICWWGSKGIKWMRDPLNQCRVAWHIFHDVQHDSPDPAWAL